LDTSVQVTDPVTENEISLTEDLLNDIIEEGLKRAYVQFVYFLCLI